MSASLSEKMESICQHHKGFVRIKMRIMKNNWNIAGCTKTTALVIWHPLCLVLSSFVEEIARLQH